MEKEKKEEQLDTVYKRSAVAKKHDKERHVFLTIRNKLYDVQQSVIIGRDKSCDIVLDDALVSRRHAKLIRDDEKYYIEDLNSTNGTYVNNNPLLQGLKKKLHSNDELRVGNTIIIFTRE